MRGKGDGHTPQAQTCKHRREVDAAGSATVESQILDQKPESLQAWIGQLRQRFAGRPVALALEQSRGSLLYALMNVDFLLLYPVNPQNLAKYRKAFYCSGAKDDPQDAQLLLEMLEKHRDRLRVWVPDDADTRCLRLLAENRRKLVHRRTALTNQLTSLLKESFPQALDWAGSLSSLRACDFLESWPSLPALQKTSPSRLRNFYRRHTRDDAQTLQQRLDQIRQAQPLLSDPAVLTAAELMIPALVKQLRCLIESIHEGNGSAARATVVVKAAKPMSAAAGMLYLNAVFMMGRVFGCVWFSWLCSFRKLLG